MRTGFRRLSVAVGFAFLCAPVAWAGAPLWETDIGLDLYDYNYSEIVQAPLQSTETGLLLGLKGGVRFNPHWHRKEELYFKLNAEYSGSGTSTTRTINNTSTVINGSTNNIFFHLELESGLDVYKWDDDNLLIAFAGFGFRWWRRGDGSAINSTTPGYRELYKWPELELGTRYSHRINEKWTVLPEIALVWMPTGDLDIYNSDYNSTLQNSSVTLGGTAGFRLAAAFRYQVEDKIWVAATPWFQYSTIGQSNIVPILNTSGAATGNSVFEPNSRTYQFGVYLSFAMASRN